MKFYIFLSFCLLIGCSSNQVISDQPVIVVERPTPSPTIQSEQSPLLKPIAPRLRLNFQETKYLNSSIPPDVRKLLENSEVFEILAEVGIDDRMSETALQTFEPNRMVSVADENSKKEILESFYWDAGHEEGAANCYEPHHAIRASYKGNEVKIEICFDCARFEIRSSIGDFHGTIVRENRKSEKLFGRLFKERSIELK